MGLKVLPTLVGLSLWDCLALAFCTLIVSQLGRFVKRFLKFLSKDFFYSVRPSPLVSCGLLLTSLTLYHNLGDLSRGFLHFFSRTGFEPAIFPHSGREFPISLPLPLTLQIIAHLPIECNRQNTQNRDFYFPKLCATFRLTNCWRCVIMEICAPHTRGRAAEFVIMHNKKAHRFCKPKPKAVGKFNSNVGYFGSHPYRFFIMSSILVRSGLKRPPSRASSAVSITIKSNQSWLFRAPPLSPSHKPLQALAILHSITLLYYVAIRQSLGITLSFCY